jgi:cytochrome c-type biogenesis protein
VEAFVAAFSLGLMVAISPCALAGNIATLVYISRRLNDRKYPVMSSILYVLGRMTTYSIFGILIVAGALQIRALKTFLENYGFQVLGPLLVVMGILMLFANRLPGIGGSDRLSKFTTKVGSWGPLGPFLLGIIFSLAFCPYSAIIFFGALIPMAIRSTGGLALPAVFAIGTGLPVLVLGILLSVASYISKVSAWYTSISRAERVIRTIVALAFIGAGIYYLLEAYVI